MTLINYKPEYESEVDAKLTVRELFALRYCCAYALDKSIAFEKEVLEYLLERYPEHAEALDIELNDISILEYSIQVMLEELGY